MPDLANLRLAIRPARHANEAALLRLRDLQIRHNIASNNFSEMDEAHIEEARAIMDGLVSQVAEARAAQAPTQARLDGARANYQQATPSVPLWQQGAGLPVLLLPVRLETIFRDAEGGSELLIRVYPDDVHVDAHEEELTPAERGAGERYLRELAAAQSNQPLRDAAWRALVERLGPPRAAWVRQALVTSGPAGPTERAAAWTRAPHTTLLPDQFVFSGYNDAGDGELELVWRQAGAPIPDLLPVGVAPPASAKREQSRDDLPWDDGCHWLVNFDEAERVGMGLTVKLDTHDPAFDLITVVGVIAGDDPEQTAARWQTTLQAHRFGDGLAVLPPGTPTNNTPASRSGWHSQPEPPTADAVDAQVARYDPDSDQAAARAARAFGVDGAAVLAGAQDGPSRPGASFARAQAGEADSDLLSVLQEAAAMLFGDSSAWAAWPPGRTADRFPFHLQPDLSPVGDHFLAHVRSRGSLPTLRIGRQPYGLLPAAALDLWYGSDPDPRVVEHVTSTLNAFLVRTSNAVRVGKGHDQDAVILDLLNRQPAASRVDVHERAEGYWADESLFLPAGLQYFEPHPTVVGSIPFDRQAVYFEPSDQFAALTLNHDSPGLSHRTTVGDDVPAAMRDLIVARPLRGLDEIHAAFRALYESHVFGSDPADRPTEQQLWGRLFQHMTTNGPLLPLTGGPFPGVFYDFASFIMWRRFYAMTKVFKFLPNRPEIPPDAVATYRRTFDRAQAMTEVMLQLEARAETDLPVIERLLVEILETLSHRIDAWVTSVADARLSRIRAEHPTGLHVGAYGWLTGVSRGGSDVESDGYVVTPSMHHAATAAVLRSGFRTHSDPRTLAVDLQSWRARRAQEIVDGVRDGQQLGALLGYQFERGLHDAQLDRLITDLRTRYPLAATVAPEATGDAEAKLARAARSVVDGQAVRADRDAFNGAHPLLGDDPQAQATVTALVRDLDDTVDAVADLLLAESVHHLVSGNRPRAGLSADTLGRAEGVPEVFDVVRTPRSASSLACHVGLVGPPSGGAGAAGWSDERALARLEPAIEGWCRARLGAASAWKFACRVQAADGTAEETTVDLESLDWCALDVVSAALPGAASPLVQAVRRRAGRPTDMVLLGDDGTARAAELALICGQLRATLQGGEPLLGTHLDPASHNGWAPADLEDLHRRVAPWLDAVIAAAADLGRELAEKRAPGGPLTALADLGLHTAAPPPGADAAAHGAEVLARLDALDLKPLTQAPAADDPGVGVWAQQATASVSTVAGAHLRVVPVLRIGLPDERLDGADADAIADWLRAVTPLRPRAAALDNTLVAARVLAGAPDGTFRVTQSPAAASDRWVATVSPVGATPDETVRSTLVLHSDTPPGERVAGLIVDSWTEAVPYPGGDNGPEEIAGVAFHYDRPGARAPQAMLLAVPPDPERGWCLEDVHGVVEDTLMLARIRGMDLRDLPDMRALLPIPIGSAGANPAPAL